MDGGVGWLSGWWGGVVERMVDVVVERCGVGC